MIKYPFFLLFTALFFLFACNNDNKNGSASIDSAMARNNEMPSIYSPETEELQQLTPYSLEEMKALLPGVIDGDSAMNIVTRQNMGTGFAKAEYQLTDSSSLELSLFDCGGVAGAGIYNNQFASMLMSNSENNREYSKIIDFGEGKAIERMDKKRKIPSLTYIARDRLLVTIEGKNIEAGKLKQLATTLNL